MKFSSIHSSLCGSACSMVFLLFISDTQLSAQDKDLGDSLKAKEVVDETKEYEERLRKELSKKVAEKHSETLEKLRRLARKYKSNGERRDARLVLRLIAKMEKSQGSKDKRETTLESDVFEYGKEYFFKHSRISGRITFLSNGKARVIYKLDDSSRNEEFGFEEMNDHVLIKNGGSLGKMYISEVPKSNKKSIMIRLGGKLRHEVITAQMR